MPIKANLKFTFEYPHFTYPQQDISKTLLVTCLIAAGLPRPAEAWGTQWPAECRVINITNLNPRLKILQNKDRPIRLELQ